MADLNPVVATLGLFGALITGGGFTTLVTTFTGKRARKVDEVDKFSQLQASLREEIRQENVKLTGKLENVEKAVVGLTNMLYDLFPRINGLTDEERNMLRHLADTTRLLV